MKNVPHNCCNLSTWLTNGSLRYQISIRQGLVYIVSFFGIPQTCQTTNAFTSSMTRNIKYQNNRQEHLECVLLMF